MEMKNNKHEILDILLTYEFNLRNDLETLQICMNSLNCSDDISEENKGKLEILIESLIEKIEAEIETYKEESKKLSKGDKIDFDFIKIRYNKLVLQIEKVFSSNPTFSEICNKLPKRQDNSMRYPHEKENNMIEMNTSDRNFNPKNKIPKQNYASNNSTLRSLSNNAMKEAIQSKTYKTPPLDFKSKEFIKKELISLKELMIELKQKMETHTHEEYESELNHLKSDNMKIYSDYKLIKRDNTEIMHSLHNLIKKAENISSENKTLMGEITNLKKFMKIDSKEEIPKYQKKTIIKEENPERKKRILLNENNLKEFEKDMLSSWAIRKLHEG